jgi:hypothetical protein
MTEQARLDVLRPQGLGQQRIVEEINLPYGKVVRGAPPGVHALQRIRAHVSRLGQPTA